MTQVGTSSPSRPMPLSRCDFSKFESLGVRWMDCDMFGHVNNVIYYAYFDTVVNTYLTRMGVLDPVQGAVIGLVVETGCHYYEPILFPSKLDVGVRVTHIGRTSVCYELAVFRQGDETSCARGRFVHVYVDRALQRPTSLPKDLRCAVEALKV